MSAAVKDEGYIPVRLGLVDLVWDKGADGSGPLTLACYFDEHGEMDFGHMLSGISYAHVFEDGTIMRHKEIIGTVDDLQPRKDERFK